MVSVKACTRCGELKDSTHYYKRSNGAIRSECKDCSNKRSKEYRNTHKNQILDKRKKYYEDNKETIKYKAKVWAKENPHKRREIIKRFEDRLDRTEYNKKLREYRKANPIKTLLRSAKQRARKGGKDFDLIEDDIIIPKVCPLLGIEIDCESDNKWVRPSIDRIDSGKGYTKDNIHVTSWRANMLKNNATASELIEIGTNMVRIQGGLTCP